MSALIYPILAILYLVMAGGLVFHFIKHRQSSSLLILLVVAGLIYDSVVIWAGAGMGVSSMLELLNRGRYMASAVLVPLLFIVAAAFAVRAGLPWASEGLVRVMEVVAGLLVLAGLLAFSVQAVEPITYESILRYKINNQLTPLWAVPEKIFISILSNLFFVTLGYFFWRKYRWPWLGIGAMLTFVLTAVPGPVIFIAEAIGEALLSITLVATDHFLIHHAQPQKA